MNYRGSAGTLPYNLAADIRPTAAGGTTVSSGSRALFGSRRITDGTSNTALFSERCLGTSSFPDLKADYYLNGTDPNTCRNAAPGLNSRYAVPHELSGQRWGDGALFYTRYNHVFPPNWPSCLLGGTTDYGSQVVVSASSRHPGGVNVATADGSVHFSGRSSSP